MPKKNKLKNEEETKNETKRSPYVANDQMVSVEFDSSCIFLDKYI